MKRNQVRYIAILVLALGLSFAFGQVPKPPNGDGNAPDSGNTVVGGGAPIGGGLLILISAAAAYGYMQYRKKPKYTITEEID